MDGEEDGYQRTWDRAVGLLSRREHSAHELNAKLVRKGVDAGTAARVIDDLKQRGYLSDQRFTEAYIRSRAERGDGPIKIRQALRARGVADDLIERSLDPEDTCWERRLAEVRSKKFGVAAPTNYGQWAKQARFLQGRGFSAEQIRKVVSWQE